MKQSSSRTIVKNFVVALMLGVAALATWAVTQSNAPTVGATGAQTNNG
jgi:hypothetical protein